MSRLPGILGQIEELVGRDAALILARERGGTTMTFSGRQDGELARIIGAEKAQRIAGQFGGVIKYRIPMAHVRGARGRRLAAARMSAQGASAAEIARELDIHERTVFRVRERQRETPDLPLFPDLPLTTVRGEPQG